MANGDLSKEVKPGDELDTEHSLLGEFWTFLMENKIWWITPAVLILVVMIIFVVFSGLLSEDGAVAPFIYTLF